MTKDSLIDSPKRQALFDKYFEEHVAKGCNPYEAALLAYDDVKSDIKNGEVA